MSNYAVGPYGLMMTSALLVLGLGVSALALGLYRDMRPTGRSLVGLKLLGGAAAGMILAGIFPTDAAPHNTLITTIGVIHYVASFVFSPCLVAAALLLSGQFQRDERWQGLQRPIYVLALVTWASFIALVVLNIVHPAVGGIAQRIFLALALGWLILTATCLRSIVTA
jgi:hypothetical membrane protein